MDDRRRSLLRATSALLLAAQLVNVAPALAAPAPAGAATAAAKKNADLVARAQTMYDQARYDEAVGLLAGPVLRKEISGSELVAARLVLARCYVKKGILPRAKQHFEAILAIDPAFKLDRAKVDADELAVFNEVKGVPATPEPAPAPVKAPPEAKAPPAKEPPPATGSAQPQLHKPEVPAASASGGQSWLAKNKYLALGLVVGGGVAAGLALGGGGGGSSTPPGPNPLPGFPSVPGGH